ncbi:MAG: tRNA (adenosine(37)-N6)-dimethylallyltransferase MiaA [Alphaproteobacteria bacterium]|nr:tRNA (adenosine(37)-N6)-dimethylallyltransferase MiaA [Alphaproteobacteria bacterium]
MPASSVIVIYGATASGKSALALDLAVKRGGTVINADSMQAYAGLPILTAAPTAEEMAQAPHVLYGYIDPATPASAASWAEDAAREIRRCWQAGSLPIVVGGTGMYIKALTQGFSPIPEISPEVRERVRAMPLEEIRARLAEADPAISARLKEGDTQRLARAYEVFMETQRPLSLWQETTPESPIPEAEFHLFGLNLPRELLYARCDARLQQMMENGALDELQALLNRNLPSSLPALRAVGVPELAAYLRGESTREEALAKAQQATRNYAKRQLTWMRNQFPDATLITYPYDGFDSQFPNLV